MKKLFWIGGPIVIVVILLLVAVIKIGPVFNFYIVPPSPKTYVKTALAQMEGYGFYAEGEKWEDTKSKVLKETRNAENYKETHRYLEQALAVAGRKHSFLDTADENDNSSDSNKLEYPKTSLNNDILTIKLPEFSGNEDESKRYAKIANDALQQKKYHSVIIDLRNNEGGDMGPMIAGVSSLLKNGTLMTYIDKDNNQTEVKLDGSATENGGTSVNLKNAKKAKSIPVAILINNKTASSGEITTLAFKGQKNVRYFGENSAGYTSANTPIDLYDGSTMYLTTAKLKDHTGKVYENNPIEPDVKTKDAKQEAEAWLEQQTGKNND